MFVVRNKQISLLLRSWSSKSKTQITIFILFEPTTSVYNFPRNKQRSDLYDPRFHSSQNHKPFPPIKNPSTNNYYDQVICHFQKSRKTEQQSKTKYFRIFQIIKD